MAALPYPLANAPDCKIGRGDLNEMENRLEAGKVPALHMGKVHARRESGFHREGGSGGFSGREAAKQDLSSSHRGRWCGGLPLDLVSVQKLNSWVEKGEILTRKRGLAGTVGSANEDSFRRGH